ncbi:unnamed protein product [Eruca vesicaria subsp. sativa]|uniref:Uncharacterized protein n=1 Tax=Eruca vesicaria subsp. sativa TaxID=29727 RepID=A0ABC8KUH5_ERUVS|nr:unnamed protein product [Eruca vesicaria subsp. sativa]
MAASNSTCVSDLITGLNNLRELDQSNNKYKAKMLEKLSLDLEIPSKEVANQGA